jgi:hypothetical protein
VARMTLPCQLRCLPRSLWLMLLALSRQKQHRHAHDAGDNYSVWQCTGIKPLSAESNAAYDARQSTKYGENRPQHEERKWQQLARAKGPGCPVKRPLRIAVEGLGKKSVELRYATKIQLLQHFVFLMICAS